MATALLRSDLAAELAIKIRELLENKLIRAESSKLNKSTQKMLFVCTASVIKFKTCNFNTSRYGKCVLGILSSFDKISIRSRLSV